MHSFVPSARINRYQSRNPNTQFKKGNLVYSSGGGKNSVKEVKNQAEEAFEKELFDVDGHSKGYISRFIVAATGDINENARRYIGKAREKGQDRRIDYWIGDRLAEYIQDNWLDEFKKYFEIDEKKSETLSIDDLVIDAEYIEENHEELVDRCRKVKMTIGVSEWKIILEICLLSADAFDKRVEMSDLLMELGNTEDFYGEEFKHLHSLGYIDFEERNISLSGKANSLHKLYDTIMDELIEAEEDKESNPDDLLNQLLKY